MRKELSVDLGAADAKTIESYCLLRTLRRKVNAHNGKLVLSHSRVSSDDSSREGTFPQLT